MAEQKAKAKYITVTIDGPAGAGKSSAAAGTAKALNFRSLNVGEIYRAIADKYLKLNKPELKTNEQIEAFVASLDVSVKYIGNEQHTFSDGEDVTPRLHTQIINHIVAAVSPHKPVREYVIKIQRQIAAENNIVADGRDVGLNVLPEAQFKFYLTASLEVRAKRRFMELLQDGNKGLKLETVVQEIMQRDEDDTKRANGGLRMASDAILIDTTYTTLDEIVTKIVATIKQGKKK